MSLELYKYTMSTNTFIVRNNPRFVNYVRQSWRYFLRNNIEGVKITIRKNSVFVHISQYYCVVCNDLVFMRRNPETYRMEASKKSLSWLSNYER